jgi:hypothetical protein
LFLLGSCYTSGMAMVTFFSLSEQCFCCFFSFLFWGRVLRNSTDWAWNPWFSCFYLWSVEVTDMYHPAQFSSLIFTLWQIKLLKMSVVPKL